MSRPHQPDRTALVQAVEMFTAEFRKRYPAARIEVDGAGYEDEDLDLNVYVDGDQMELEQHAVEVSHRVQSETGYFILPFIYPTAAVPTR
jgi:hypothetical protein